MKYRDIYRDTYRIVTQVSRYVSHRDFRYRAIPNEEPSCSFGVNSLSSGRWLVVAQRYNAQIEAAMIGCEAMMICELTMERCKTEMQLRILKSPFRCVVVGVIALWHCCGYGCGRSPFQHVSVLFDVVPRFGYRGCAGTRRCIGAGVDRRNEQNVK